MKHFNFTYDLLLSHLLGIFLLAASVRNAIWMWFSTVEELRDNQINTPKSSKLESVSFHFLISLSTYHLLWMSVQRYLAIKYPVQIQKIGKWHTLMAIILTWTLSLFASFSMCKLSLGSIINSEIKVLLI